MRVTVILFPGSNCDHDVVYSYQHLLGQHVSVVWHRDTDLDSPDLVIIPGGFSYGDYLRTGALAKLSPAMKEVSRFAARGGPVIGICNGFQILCEAGLIPGVLLQNMQRRFLSQFVHIRVEQSGTPLTHNVKPGTVITCPMAHFEGNYFAPEDVLEKVEGDGLVVFRYCSKDGAIESRDIVSNPNGAANSIAGVCNKQKNVVGLMPHPERAAEKLVGLVGRSSGLELIRASLG